MTDKTREKIENDRAFLSDKVKYIAGVDEVGRGPLAGPVVCCAAIMPLDDENAVDGVDDSKKVSAKKRESLYETLKSKAIAYKICRIADFLLGGADGKDVGFAVAEVTEEGVNIIFDAF